MKKLLLLGSMVMVVMAFGITASASAWTKEGKPLTKDATITLNGTFGWENQSLASGYQCQAEGEVTLLASGGQKVDSFELDGSSCQGFGLYGGCEYIASQFTGQPLFEGSIHWTNETDENCSAGGREINGSSTGEFDNTSEISRLDTHGTGCCDFGAFARKSVRKIILA
jgi:hypothetical protein